MAKKRKQQEGAQGTQPSNKAAKQAADGASPAAGTKTTINKEKVLILSTRGITFRYRHLMNDMIDLIPHCKKDSKLDTKNDRNVVNEVADMKGCTSAMFFEVRKKMDLYLWMAKTPDGPSAKFLVENIHTMAELKLSGNHLKGSRPVLTFHKAFDEQPHLQLLKELFIHMYATPPRHHKCKPFMDHVMAFSYADGRVWFRNYQVVVPLDKKKVNPDSATLVEVGPRFCLNPIKIFEGSFGGRTLFENPRYISPNALRSAAKRASSTKYSDKVQQRNARKEHVASHSLPQSELEGLFASQE